MKTRLRFAFTVISALASLSTEAFAAGGPRAISVDASRIVGVLRSLQGAHYDPGPPHATLSDNYKRMGVDLIRTHDAGIVVDSGVADLDGIGADRIFPDLNADPSDPASYNFGPTDIVLGNMLATGAELYFRVGRSANQQFIPNNTVPPDLDRYAEIVRHVVLHYNKGWAHGFHHRIRYFEIWNEPDFLPFWAGTAEQYYELYEKVALAIRRADPHALVGGPTNTSFNDDTGFRESFLDFVRERRLPFDFLSFHKYTDKSNDPLDYARIAQTYRGLLDSRGFRQVQIVNSEYGPSLVGDPVIGGPAGIAAFLATAQMYMQNAPVERAMSYMSTGDVLSKENLGFAAVSMLNRTPLRLQTSGGDDTGFAVLSGARPLAKELRVVIANYEISPLLMGPIPGGNDESIDIPGLGHLGTLTLLDRRSITYHDTEGYQLRISRIPRSWGDLTVEQYRVDNEHDLTLVSSQLVHGALSGPTTVNVAGSWVHAPPAPPADPVGVGQGVDVIVVRGADQ